MILGTTVSNPVIDLTDCKMTHTEAVAQVILMGVQMPSDSECGGETTIACVSLEQINCDSIGCLRQLKMNSQCDITITAGTETNDEDGYKIGIALDSCIDTYISNTFQNVEEPTGGTTQYVATNGNTFTKETDHWSIRFTNYC
ncbi:unnamed protein product [Rotaria sordida]|uniref:Uncharacterized protein n=1 Tax=Rotaria sordida TaxID=392033 RepID=A0A814X4F0_9BILA|nr:unnamed protein product [Rotaria sordida]CAF1211215.1 unnamed protein product [Rotaria sordida]